MTYKSQKKNLLAKYHKSDIIRQRGSLEKSMVLGDGCVNTLSPTNGQSAPTLFPWLPFLCMWLTLYHEYTLVIIYIIAIFFYLARKKFKSPLYLRFRINFFWYYLVVFIRTNQYFRRFGSIF